MTGSRVALVVGIDHYARGTGHIFAPDLANPINDAGAMRDALTKLGFSVVYGEDLGKEEFEAALDNFEDHARSADIALVYFSGHGSTFEDEPYLVPADATFDELRQTERKLIKVEDVLKRLRQIKGVRIALFDACRNNEAEQILKQQVAGTKRAVAQTRGLGRVQHPPDGLIVMYAAQFLQTADDQAAGSDSHHSPFTAALLDKLPTPDENITTVLEDVARSVIDLTDGHQIPELVIDLFDKFQLVGSGALVPTSSTTAPAPAPLPQQPTVTAPVSPAPAPVTECDRLAAAPDDIDRAHAGVASAKIDAPVAEAACLEAVQKFPRERRLLFQLGRAFDAGGNYHKAVLWYQKAADLGHAEAMNNIGHLYHYGYLYYDYGHGPKQSYGEALHWYQRAADLGDANAMKDIGVLYDEGRGMKVDYAEAMNWYRKAANLGNAEAMKRIGHLYDKGLGVKQDHAEAKRWYQMATGSTNDDGFSMMP